MRGRVQSYVWREREMKRKRIKEDTNILPTKHICAVSTTRPVLAIQMFLDANQKTSIKNLRERGTGPPV